MNSISPINYQNPFFPLVKKVKELQAEIPAPVKKAFAELAISLSLNFALLTFTATPLSIPILTVTALCTIVSLTAKIALEYALQKNKLKLSSRAVPIAQATGRLAIINAIGLSGINAFIHECGHAIAAKACFLKPNVRIKIWPFKGGQTSYAISYGLTRFGNFLGKNEAILFATAAGIGCSTLFAMGEFAAAFAVKDKFPEISLSLNCHAISQILNEVLYGISAFASSQAFNLGHDFIRLWKFGGIHPIIPIGLMIALPAAEIAALYGVSFFTNRGA